jgi:DNA invertase Pin-like site-specific DNA recombinase
MRVVAYIRVSTEHQAVEGVSLAAQEGRIRAWCASRGAPLADADVHVDAGLSGKRADNRPALQAALDSVCRGGAVLVVYSLSRLARSVRDTITIAERLERAGADLVSLSEKIDTTSASGKMVFRMLAVLAEFERDLISERTRTALGHKRSKSERIGQVPYGMSLQADGRTLTPHPGELEVLATMHRLRSEGLSPRAVAGELTRRGFPTKNGGPRWSHTTVVRILNRRKGSDHEQGDDQSEAGRGAAVSGAAYAEQPAA